MSDEKHGEGTPEPVMREYVHEHKFSEESGVIKDEQGRIVLTQAFCPEGHSLITDEAQFDGYNGIKVLGLYDGKEYTIILSPIMHDKRKQCPEFPDGAIVDLVCPVCKKPLPRIAPCGCQLGSFYRQVYLTPHGDKGSSIGICDAYGCPRSFIRDEGEIISEVHMDLLWQVMGKHRYGMD